MKNEAKVIAVLGPALTRTCALHVWRPIRHHREASDGSRFPHRIAPIQISIACRDDRKICLRNQYVIDTLAIYCSFGQDSDRRY